MSAFLENQSGTDLNDTQITRRGAMGRLATLLAMGAWPGLTGCLAPSGKRSPVSSIRFVVTNDFHHEEDACDPWMRALFSQVGETEGAAFCFALGDLANRGKRSSLERMRDHLRLTEVPT